MRLSELPNIDFVDVDTETVEKSVFTAYQNITGRTPALADPIRLFLLFIADVLVQMRNNLNYTGKQNLLKYSEGDNLDNLAALVGVTRNQATAAHTSLRVTLSALLGNEVVVPDGTRVATQNNIKFATSEDLMIPAGETEGIGHAICTEIGAVGNNFKAGEISNIVDPIAYVAKMVNTTMSEGGANTESDDSLRERTFEAPEHFSTAGPRGAYEYWTYTSSSLIQDVSATSPTPGVVQIVPLLEGGVIPGQEILTQVEKTLSASKVRPLTDKVIVKAPVSVGYDIDTSYYIDKKADASFVQEKAAKAVTSYVTWQKSRIGRDIVPSKLIQLLMTVDGVKRVDVIAPTFTPVSGDSVAQEGTINVRMAGSEEA